MKARSAKAKGTRLEAWVVQQLKEAGIDTARRQPGSGIYSDFPHDVFFHLDGRRYVVECKARKEGHRTLDKWKGLADVLIIRADRSPPNVYMTMELFLDLLQTREP